MSAEPEDAAATVFTRDNSVFEVDDRTQSHAEAGHLQDGGEHHGPAQAGGQEDEEEEVDLATYVVFEGLDDPSPNIGVFAWQTTLHLVREFQGFIQVVTKLLARRVMHGTLLPHAHACV